MLTFTVNKLATDAVESLIFVYHEHVAKYGVEWASDQFVKSLSELGLMGNVEYGERSIINIYNHKLYVKEMFKQVHDLGVDVSDASGVACSPLQPEVDVYDDKVDELTVQKLFNDLILSGEIHNAAVEHGINLETHLRNPKSFFTERKEETRPLKRVTTDRIGVFMDAIKNLGYDHEDINVGKFVGLLSKHYNIGVE